MLGSKTDMVSLKTEVDNIAVDKLKNVPVDWSELSNVVDNILKEVEYDNLLSKFNATDTKISTYWDRIIVDYTRRLVTKTQYDSDKQGLEKKIEDVD